eukprot:6175412-Pleurochrysis_carterae.AAC.2
MDKAATRRYCRKITTSFLALITSMDSCSRKSKQPVHVAVQRPLRSLEDRQTHARDTASKDTGTGQRDASEHSCANFVLCKAGSCQIEIDRTDGRACAACAADALQGGSAQPRRLALAVGECRELRFAPDV